MMMHKWRKQVYPDQIKKSSSLEKEYYPNSSQQKDWSGDYAF
jgi:hypothetical protein